jgi:hypothetical protein
VSVSEVKIKTEFQYASFNLDFSEVKRNKKQIPFDHSHDTSPGSPTALALFHKISLCYK